MSERIAGATDRLKKGYFLSLDEIRNLFLDAHELFQIDLIRSFRQPQEKIGGLFRLLSYSRPHTAHHSAQVRQFAVEMAGFCMRENRLKLSDETLVIVANGALVHDVGKIGVPQEVLDQPGYLDSPDEQLIRRSHGRIGADIVSAVSLDGVFARFCLEHHIGNSRRIVWQEEELARRHQLTPFIAIADFISAAQDPWHYPPGGPATKEEIYAILMRKFSQGLFPSELQPAFIHLMTCGLVE